METAELLWALKWSQTSAGGANIGGWTQMSQCAAWTQKQWRMRKVWMMKGVAGGWAKNGRESGGGQAGENGGRSFNAEIYSEWAKEVFLCPLAFSLLQNNHSEVPCLRVYNTRIRKQCVYTFWWLLSIRVLAWESGEPESCLDWTKSWKSFGGGGGVSDASSEKQGLWNELDKT